MGNKQNKEGASHDAGELRGRNASSASEGSANTMQSEEEGVVAATTPPPIKYALHDIF